jgi:hypothetical protein
MDYDREAINDAPSARMERMLDRAACVSCGRKMYKTPLSPMEPTQWRHDSTGHAISWTPTRHTATVKRVPRHAHRWCSESSGCEGEVVACTVTGCDTKMLDTRKRVVEAAPLTEKEQHVAESRRRGGDAKRRLQAAKA